MNPIDLTEKEQQIAQLLLDYMKKHSDAKHTAEGIARWWIMQQKLEEDLNLVVKIIDYFTAKGVLEKIQIANGNHYYKFQQKNLEGESNAR